MKMDIDEEKSSGDDDLAVSLNVRPDSCRTTQTVPSNQDLSDDSKVQMKCAMIMNIVKETTQPPKAQTVEEQRPVISVPTGLHFIFPDFNIDISDFEVKACTKLSYRCDQLPSAYPRMPELTIKGRTGTNSLVTRHRHCRPRKTGALIAGRSWLEERRLLAAVKQADAHETYRLLAEGFDPNVADEKKRTALHLAASQGNLEIVDILLIKGSDPNRQDILGNTPLHLAVCRGNRLMVKRLLEGGADVTMRDSLSRTPLMIVTSRLTALRKNKAAPADKLYFECEMILYFLRMKARKLGSAKSIDSLCDMMGNVTTREQADEMADAVIDKMANLNFANKASSADKTQHLPGPLSIL